MSSSLISKLTTVATAFTLGLIVLAASASADVGWIVQPSSQLGGSATLHLPAFDVNDPSNPNPDPNSEGYVPAIDISSIPQTDAGTSGDPALGKAAVNSLLGSGQGYFKTVGNTVTSSLDFGNPAHGTVTDLTISAKTIGNFLPAQDGSASTPAFLNGQPVYNFGSPAPSIAAATLWTQTPTSGFNALTGSDFSASSRDNGRISTFGLNSIPTSSVPIPVTNGVFDATNLAFYGTIGVSLTLAIAADPQLIEGVNPASQVLPPSFVGINHVSNSLTGAAVMGSMTRGGVGVNTGPDYIMTAPFRYDFVLTTNTDGSPQLTIPLQISLVAKANLVQGDTNFDGVVDIQDLTQMANNWLGTNAQHLGNGDANGDGIVDIQDLTMAANHWLQTSPALGGGGGGSVNSVPEPGSLLLLGLGAVSMLLMARKRVRR